MASTASAWCPSADNPYQSNHLQAVWRDEAMRGKTLTPFFRGSGPTQPSAQRDWPGGRIEGFSTTGEGKRETTPLFKPADGCTSWVFGAPNATDFARSREVPSRIMNNSAPEPQHVGPGLGIGPDAPAMGGFQQFDALEHERRAVDRATNVDSTRTLSKPKPPPGEGRALAGGNAVSARGLLGAFAKNRTEKTWATGEKYLLTTPGARIAPSADSLATTLDRCTTRECTGDTGGQAGPLGPAGVAAAHTAPTEPANVSRRCDPADSGDRGLANSRERGAGGAGTKDDFGRASVLVYANERDVTSCQTVKTNVQSVVKAVTAPLMDLFRHTRKVFTLDAPREHGQLQASFPAKMTVYDPNDRLRTTIKETLIHDAVRMNLRGSTRLTTYDPNDRLRTTIKETLIHDAVRTNLRGSTRVITYDPDFLVAKATVRETVPSANPNRNMRPPTLKLTLIDPDDRAKTTVKETAMLGYRPGGPEREGDTGYLSQAWDARMTQRADIDPDTEYGGNPGEDRGGGYQPEVTPIDVANVATQRSVDTVDPSRVGALSGDRRPTSDEADAAAYINDTRDGVLALRDPTKVSVMLGKGKEWVAMQAPAKAPPCAPRAALEQTRISMAPEMPPPCAATQVRSRLDVDADARLDPALLDAFRNNPYTQSLHSF